MATAAFGQVATMAASLEEAQQELEEAGERQREIDRLIEVRRLAAAAALSADGGRRRGAARAATQRHAHAALGVAFARGLHLLPSKAEKLAAEAAAEERARLALEEANYRRLQQQLRTRIEPPAVREAPPLQRGQTVGSDELPGPLPGMATQAVEAAQLSGRDDADDGPELAHGGGSDGRRRREARRWRRMVVTTVLVAAALVGTVTDGVVEGAVAGAAAAVDGVAEGARMAEGAATAAVAAEGGQARSRSVGAISAVWTQLANVSRRSSLRPTGGDVRRRPRPQSAHSRSGTRMLQRRSSGRHNRRQPAVVPQQPVVPRPPASSQASQGGSSAINTLWEKNPCFVQL